jgi:5-methyltetrahydropteroyltriglutamate--homocysteine methyltransferase
MMKDSRPAWIRKGKGMAAQTTSLDRLRVDHIGSLLRPDSLKQAFRRHDAGEMNDEGLHLAEDDAIRRVISLQEAHGMPVVSDGEFRRHGFQESFGEAVSGFDSTPPVYTGANAGGRSWSPGRRETGITAPGPAIGNRRPAKERLQLSRNVILDEYRFGSQVATVPVKVTLIGPDRISQRFEWESSQSVYADMDAFLADVIAIERRMIAEVVAAGCRYVQVDAPGFTAYVDPPSLERMRSRGEDPMENLDRSIRAENAIVAGFPDVTFAIHICRGNGAGWHREGHYDAIAEQLFSRLAHQRLLLEYDTERAGSFNALRFVPKDKMAVLGLISTKLASVETVDELSRRVEEAARFLPLDQLGLSPQCGFASGIEGNPIGEDAQWSKLDVMLRTAEKIWGI